MSSLNFSLIQSLGKPMRILRSRLVPKWEPKSNDSNTSGRGDEG